jgi:hypothetical protein
MSPRIRLQAHQAAWLAAVSECGGGAVGGVMDWDAAYNGCCNALAKTAPHIAITKFQMAMVYHVERMGSTDNYGDTLVYQSVADMEPTFENEWDYEWPTDFAPATD